MKRAMRRYWKPITLIAACFALLAVNSFGGATFSRVKVWSSSETLTAAQLNAEFDNILNNFTPTGMDDASANATAMQATADPYPGGVASLPTNLQGEIQRLRYAIAQIKGTTYWYQPYPAGVIQMYGGSSAPAGWLICDGSAVSRTTYAALFDAIGDAFGAGDGSTTFNVPDFRGRAPIGVGTGTGGGASGTGAPTGGSALTARALGAWTGEETHALTEAEGPAHQHQEHALTIIAEGTSQSVGTGTPGWTIANSGTYKTEASGSGTAHNTMQPSLAVNFIIKY